MRVDIPRALFEEWESATDHYEELERLDPMGEVNEAAQAAVEASVKVLAAIRTGRTP